MIEEAGAHGRRLPLVERGLECFDRVSSEGLAPDCGMLPVYFARRDAADS